MALSHRGLLGGKIGGKTLQIGVCTTAASGFLLFGYDRKSIRSLNLGLLIIEG